MRRLKRKKVYKHEPAPLRKVSKGVNMQHNKEISTESYWYLRIPRGLVEGFHGPISTLIGIWSNLPYTDGVIPTHCVDWKGVRKKGTRVEAFVWKGSVEDFMVYFPVFHNAKDRVTITSDNFEESFNKIVNHPVIAFLIAHEQIEVYKDNGLDNVVVTSKPFRQANYKPYRMLKEKEKYGISLQAQYPHFSPIAKGGYFYANPRFTYSLVPQFMEEEYGKTYDDLNLRFTLEDAFWDMYAHTVYNDDLVTGSMYGGVVCMCRHSPVLSYSYLGRRWDMTKTNVFRLFKKYSNLLTPYNLESRRGSVVYVNHFISDQYDDKILGYRPKDDDDDDDNHPSGTLDTLPSPELVKTTFTKVTKTFYAVLKKYQKWLSKSVKYEHPHAEESHDGSADAGARAFPLPPKPMSCACTVYCPKNTLIGFGGE